MFQGSIGTPTLWIGFVIFVLAMLALDLGVFHRKAHAITPREAALWSGVWVGLALCFSLGVYFGFGAERALEFTTGYVIEKALSIDNIFVFVIIFGAFSVPTTLQHRVLFWGILCALVMSGGFIVAGGAILANFHWAVYVFGGLLALTGIKLLFQRGAKMDPAQSPVVRFFRRLFPVTSNYDGERFFTLETASARRRRCSSRCSPSRRPI